LLVGVTFRRAVATHTTLLIVTLIIALILWFVPESVPARNPVLLIVLGIPLMFRLVPRNWIYGMRTPRTMWSSEETWFMQNQITGIVLLVAGLIWLGVAIEVGVSFRRAPLQPPDEPLAQHIAVGGTGFQHEVFDSLTKPPVSIQYCYRPPTVTTI
jgi:hypothetical protein